MSNPTTTIIQLAAAAANNIALSQTPGAGGPLTLNGSTVTSGVATLDVARRILISTAGADAARTFTITGTNRNGNPQSETITGIPTGTSAFTARDYKTVTSVSVDAATAGAITVGTNGVASSEWVVCDLLKRFWALGGTVTAPAATTYTIETTLDDVTKPGGAAQSLVVAPQQASTNPASFVPPAAWPHATLANVSGPNQFNYTAQPIQAIRVTVTAGTGLVVMQTAQAGL